MTSGPSKPTLFLVGVPLDEEAPLAETSRVALASAQVVIGESRKITFRYLKQSSCPNDPEVFLLDPPREDENALMREALLKLKERGGVAALLSDTGMPVLFDPGAEVLEFCRQNGFRIRTVPAATSWATAAAASGFAPPFAVVGFPPREEGERRRWWADMRNMPGHVVMMETPYRFRLLLKQLRENLGASRRVFLAWEISKPEEFLFWGTAHEVEKAAERAGLEKGEFVLVVNEASDRSGGKTERKRR